MYTHLDCLNAPLGKVTDRNFATCAGDVAVLSPPRCTCKPGRQYRRVQCTLVSIPDPFLPVRVHPICMRKTSPVAAGYCRAVLSARSPSLVASNLSIMDACRRCLPSSATEYRESSGLSTRMCRRGCAHPGIDSPVSADSEGRRAKKKKKIETSRHFFVFFEGNTPGNTR